MFITIILFNFFFRTTKRPFNQIFNANSNETLYSPQTLGSFYTTNYIQGNFNFIL